jgi:hypothetical protein
MSQLHLEISDLLERGLSPEAIAKRLNVPIDWVFGIELDMINYPQDSYDCYDTVNS